MAGDVPVWPDNMALMTVKGGCLQFLRSYPSSTSALSIYTNFTTQCRKVRIDVGSSWRICHPAPLFPYVLQDKIFNYQGTVLSETGIEREYSRPFVIDGS